MGKSNWNSTQNGLLGGLHVLNDSCYHRISLASHCSI